MALYIETFDGVPLGPNVEEASAGDPVWTKTPPTGWTVDDTGMPGCDQPDYAENDGRKEWAGWVLADVRINNQFIDGTPGPELSPTLSYTLAGGQLTLGWDGSGFTLQENANLADRNGWQHVPGAGANSATVPTRGAARFYRLMK